jgi:hypothetical protein
MIKVDVLRDYMDTILIGEENLRFGIHYFKSQ